MAKFIIRSLIGFFSLFGAIFTVTIFVIVVGIARLPKVDLNGESAVAWDPISLLHPVWWQLLLIAILTIGFYWAGNKLFHKRTV